MLVKWQYNSNLKDFLPRLGAPINHVTCSRDNLFYATCHTDNGRLYLLLLSLLLFLCTFCNIQMLSVTFQLSGRDGHREITFSICYNILKGKTIFEQKIYSCLEVCAFLQSILFSM